VDRVIPGIAAQQLSPDFRRKKISANGLQRGGVPVSAVRTVRKDMSQCASKGDAKAMPEGKISF
jgi:hypothetical protein